MFFDLLEQEKRNLISSSVHSSDPQSAQTEVHMYVYIHTLTHSRFQRRGEKCYIMEIQPPIHSISVHHSCKDFFPPFFLPFSSLFFPAGQPTIQPLDMPSLSEMLYCYINQSFMWMNVLPVWSLTSTTGTIRTGTDGESVQWQMNMLCNII